MSTYTCFIIDDEDYAVERLSEYVHKIPTLKLIGSNTNPVDAVIVLNNLPVAPDILFLDMTMPVLSGLQVIEMIDKNINIIFATGFINFAVDAFDKNAIDFLLKPIMFEKFSKTIQRVQKKIDGRKILTTSTNDEFLVLGSLNRSKVARIKLSDIIFIESMNHSICVQCVDEKHTANFSITEIQHDLPLKDFVRIHRSFIVNIKKIKEISISQVTLVGQFHLPLGNAYKAVFFEKIGVKKSKKDS